MRLASENSYGIHFCMKMAPTVSLDVLSVVIAAFGGCRDRFIKSISDKGISECSQMLSFSRCNIAFKSVTAPRVKKVWPARRIGFLGEGGLRVPEDAHNMV
jgi:hypothetical protein